MIRRLVVWSLLGAAALAAMACGDASSGDVKTRQGKPAALPQAEVPPTPADLPQGLLIALSKFERRDNKPVPLSELTLLWREGGEWKHRALDDPESNVFHKAMVYTPPGGEPGVLTFGGTEAVVKLWHKGDAGLAPVETLWKEDFGGKFSRMREGEIGDVYGDGTPTIVVVTHDQGVLSLIRAKEGGGHEVTRIDEQKDIWIHEAELGDLDGDGVLEIYATPSEPNRLDGTHQKGEVVRYVPAKDEGRSLVADLGDRHAKEILAEDVDGDGRDELYVSIEAAEGGSLEIRRFDADTPPGEGFTIAVLQDPMARFLTAGDVEGDGKKEMIVAAKDSGLWLLRPGEDPRRRWSAKLVDDKSKGFEHAALFADLDADGRSELYVASDDHKTINRYVWNGTKLVKETIFERTSPLPIFTWNLMPAPVELLRP